MPPHKIGIRREDINKWERRAPLIPTHVRELVRDHGLEIYIQPSTIRVFPDADYALEGAQVQEDIGAPRTVFAIKEIPIESLKKDKVYVFFSHTAKGQHQNMPMLKRMMELGSSIIDYEKIVNEKGQRILYFGSYAGQAGMIDSLWALGRRLKLEGVETPFLRLKQTMRYKSLVEAKEEVAEVGRLIHKKGLPPGLIPFVCGFLGYGHVSQGAQEIYDLIPHDTVLPKDLAGLFRKTGPPARGLYKVVFKEEDMVRPAAPGGVFDLQEYYREPGKYVPIVESYVPYLNLLINGIYWTPKFPKYITKPFLAKLYGGEVPPRLKVVGDITCDIDGSVECTVQATDSEEPVYVYDPVKDAALIGIEGNGPVVMAVYNLPAELPLESSAFFSGGLKKYVPAIAGADFRVPFDRCELPPEVRKAVIVYRGELTPDYRYLSGYLA
jgi:saccharopine dehydrogenase (NAD+, L-lysine-forming)